MRDKRGRSVDGHSLGALYFACRCGSIRKLGLHRRAIVHNRIVFFVSAIDSKKK